MRLAGFQSALSTIVSKAAATLVREHPGVELSLVDVHPIDALRVLRQGEVDVALIFRYADTPVEAEGFRLAHVADDPMHLVTQRPGAGITDYRESAWIGGCERCRAELISTAELSGTVTFLRAPVAARAAAWIQRITLAVSLGAELRFRR